MKSRQSLLSKVFVAALLMFAPPPASAVTVTEIVVPIPGVTFFSANAINDRGQAVGFYFDDGVRYCFLWEKGLFQTLSVPATTGTTCYGINNRSQIVGSYSDSVGTVHNFLWDAGTLNEIPVPGSPFPVGGINDRGQIAGSYFDGIDAHCYLWEKGVVRTIDIPATTAALCYAINNRDQIAGSFAGPSNSGGFVLTRGVLTSISLFLFTRAATSINDHGQAVGLFFDNSVSRGFFFDKGNPVPISLPVPDPLFSNVAINNSGDLLVTFRSFGGFPLRMILVSADH